MTDPLPGLDLGSLPGPDDIHRRELANGMVALVRENFASPSVVLSGFLRVGSIEVAPEKAGLSDLTAFGLTRGTRTRSFNQIYESLESIGASMGFVSGNHSTGFQAKSLAEDLETLLELLAEIVRRPSFPAAEVERLKGERLTALAIRDQNTGAVAQMVFHQLVYPDHPYGVPSEGYRQTVAELNPADLRAFHGTHYGPKGMVLAVVGGVEAERALEAVERALGDWTNPHQPDPRELPDLRPLTGIRRRAVHLEGKSQCDVVLGAAGPGRSDPDFLAAALGNNILGRFGLMGRIGEAVRQKAGLAYYAQSTVSGGPGPGPWQVIAGVNPANVEKAIELIRTELKRFVTRRVTRREISDNQAHFIGRLPLQLESNEGVAGALVQAERYHLGLDYYRRYPELIAGVTRNQILRTAQRFLDPERLGVAIAGPVADG